MIYWETIRNNVQSIQGESFIKSLVYICVNQEKELSQLRKLKDKISSNDFLEQLAELEHKQWIEWSQTLLKSETLSKKRIERWNKCNVDYHKLDESEKNQDRKYAKLVIQLLLGEKV